MVESVTAFTRSYDYWYDRYQLYYREGLRRECSRRGIVYREVPMTRAARVLRPVRRWRDRYLSRLPVPQVAGGVDALARHLEGPVRSPSSLFHNAVGQYLVALRDARRYAVCIDAADYPALPSQELVEWSDLYFKSNRWPSESYPVNVLPVVNGDPLILDRIDSLRASRASRKERDVCFVVRVWGGSDSVVEGIEHNLRLLEAINRGSFSKSLIAYLVAGDISGASRRLGAAGIASTRTSVQADRLWRMMAGSRVNVIRLGMHSCIPWRVAGALALGACIALDQPPRSAWPEPLREGENFLNLGLETLEAPIAGPELYAAVPAKLEEWLSDPDGVERMQLRNAEYFDRFVDPPRVGEYILDQVRAHAGGRLDGALRK